MAVDWVVISSLATAVGTLVLAAATFAAIRSSNRYARIAEAALQEQRRPLLGPSRLEDPKQKIMFLEGHWVSAAGGRAAVEHVDGVVYLAISLRNVGNGIADYAPNTSIRGNLISGNVQNGVFVSGPFATGVTIQANYIGSDVSVLINDTP